MAIAKDATSTGSGAATSWSYTHTPVGTPRGFNHYLVSDDSVNSNSAVTYGGVALAEVSGSPNEKVAAEDGEVNAWFLGASLPTGAQSVAVTAAAATNQWGFGVTVTAADDTEVVDTDVTINSDSVANPSATLSLGGVDCFCSEGIFSGRGNAAGITPLTNWTDDHEVDMGAQMAALYTYDTIGSSDVTMGWTQDADDAICIGVAIREVAVGGRIMSSLADHGGLAGMGGIAGAHGGLAG